MNDSVCTDIIDFDLTAELAQLTAIQEAKPEKPLCTRCTTDIVKPRCIKRDTRSVYRRAYSETQLLDILDINLLDGHSYHCISGGDIDSLSYLKHIVRQQRLNYVLFSTWCMADDDVLQLREWLESDKIGRIDAYCGEIFPGSYSKQHKTLKEVIEPCGGRVAIFRNHSKIYAGTGEKFDFAIESSANINTNPRTENTTIHIGTDIYRFYKEFFDNITSFNRDFDHWSPYTP